MLVVLALVDVELVAMKTIFLACLLALPPCGGDQPWSPDGDWRWSMEGVVCSPTQEPASGTLEINTTNGRITGKFEGCSGAVKVDDVDGLALPDGHFAFWMFGSDLVVTKITAPDRNHFLGQVTGLWPGVVIHGERP